MKSHQTPVRQFSAVKTSCEISYVDWTVGGASKLAPNSCITEGLWRTINVKTPRVVPYGNSRQHSAATTRQKVREVRRFRQAAVQNLIAANVPAARNIARPIPTKIQGIKA